jgi:hypothetical protein
MIDDGQDLACQPCVYMKRCDFGTAAHYYAQVVIEYPITPLYLYARRAALHARLRSDIEP